MDEFWSKGKLEEFLLNRGCIKTANRWRNGYIWIAANGTHQSVPEPPFPQGYPIRQALDIICRMGVADATKH
jgi:hypothetical protein